LLLVKIIHITDTHLVAGDATIHGLDPRARLATIVDDVIRRHADADLTVITGDLTDRGEPEAYERLAAELARLPMPVRLLLGNHDDRHAFVARFPDQPRDAEGFVQSVLDAGRAGRLVFLDTLEQGWSGGRFCDARMAWLEERLSEVRDRPVVIFMHHAPFDLRVAHFRDIGLADADRFLRLVSRHPGGVRHIVFGHVHIPVSGVGPGGIPFSSGRSGNHQIILNFAEKDCRWAAGSPNYSIIDLGEDHLFIHAFDFVEAEQIGIGAYPPGP
jgi:Icc protein